MIKRFRQIKLATKGISISSSILPLYFYLMNDISNPFMLPASYL